MAGISVAVQFLKFYKQRRIIHQRWQSFSDRRGVRTIHRPQRHNSSVCALEHGHTLSIFLAWLKPSRFILAPQKESHLYSRSDLHPSLAWTHSCTTQTQLSTWTQSSRPMSPIAVTRQRTPVKETHLAMLLNKLLVQVVSPTSKLKTCLRTILRRYMVIPE